MTPPDITDALANPDVAIEMSARLDRSSRTLSSNPCRFVRSLAPDRQCNARAWPNAVVSICKFSGTSERSGTCAVAPARVALAGRFSAIERACAMPMTRQRVGIDATHGSHSHVVP
ncbi:hypothetical protein WG70_22525 [Burkholderia oklahomensis EO147]|nr:hypothetical protein WG70_22525 [Burkholderia oklahomensis EO147]KUY52704.1 hypothetical protein WG70_00390 [Burkholderia oklahomensis EO147]